MKNRSLPIAMICLVVGLLAGRGMVMWIDSAAFRADPDAYRHIAWTLEQSGVYGTQFGPQAKPTAFRPPLYPWLLSWIAIPTDDPELCLLPFRVGCFHLVCIGVTLLVVYRAASVWWNRKCAWIACVLVGLDPILIQQSTLVMTETLAVMLSAWATWWLGMAMDPKVTPTSEESQDVLAKSFAPHWLLGFGGAVLLALAYLCRPTFLVWAALLGFACLLRSSHRRLGILIVLVIASTVGLWTFRNVRVMGHPVWATTHGGYTMLLGNNRFFYDYLRAGWSWTSWDAQPFTETYVSRFDAANQDDGTLASDWDIPREQVPTPPIRGNEIDEDRWAGKMAQATIRQHPSTFVWSCAVRVLRIWSPVPLWTEGRSSAPILIVTCFYLVFLVLLWKSLVRHGRALFRWRWLPVWTMVITLTLVHSIYWSNLRMRSPATPGLAIVAAGAFARPRQREAS